MIRLPREPAQILLIKPSALGDIVHTLPILRLLRRRFASARISWLVNPGFAGLIEGNPDLDEVIRFERARFARSWRDASAAGGLLRFKADLRRRRFDLAIDLQGLLRSAWLGWYSGAGVRVGFANAREGAPFFYSHRVPVRDTQVHAIERYLAVAEALGCGRGPVEFDFAVSNEDRAEAAAMVPGGPYAVLLPGTNWPTKRWPAERFAALVEPLRRELGFVSVVAGAGDTPRIEGASDLVGRTSLKQLVAVLERAALVIANDTGPMHIAAALGRPLVTLFGPTNPVRTGPYRRMDAVVRLNLPCSPCYERRCVHQSCLRWLGTDDVLRACARALAEVRRVALPVR